MPDPQSSHIRGVVNAAVFSPFSDAKFLKETISSIDEGLSLCVLTDDRDFLQFAQPDRRLDLDTLGVRTESARPGMLEAKLRASLGDDMQQCCIFADMSWIADALLGADALETWTRVSERFASDGYTILSFYDPRVLIEDLALIALRAHSQIAGPSGIRDNPFWLSEQMATQTADRQLTFLLERAAPDYKGRSTFNPVDANDARGTDPGWVEPLTNSAVLAPDLERWRIFCLGELRVYRGGYDLVDWNVPGGSPNKTRTLFAFLLQGGDKGVHADRIGELLWPEGESETVKRKRLHHTVAMLRRALGSKTSVIRTGETYRLNPPTGSWVDITSFEQLCRRALSLSTAGQGDAALRVYRVAEKLYGGDLFEDLPVNYVHSEQEDWCLPRRTWLREMALKVQKDMSVLLRRLGDTRKALEHAQRALTMDPTSEEANTEILHVYFDQGRREAMKRHFRQYCRALETIGAEDSGARVESVYRALLDR